MPFKDPEKARASVRASYYKNATERKRKIYARKKELRDWVRQYKQERGCSQCSETHIACLQLHHDTGKKEKAICQAVNNGWSKERLLTEMEKCIVLCANCHFKHHHSE